MSETPDRGHYRDMLYQRYVSKKYDVDTAIYSKEAYKNWARVAFKRFKCWLPEAKAASILDLGCGHGNMLALLSSAGYTNLTGVDISEEQLELASRQCPDARLVRDNLMDFLATCEEAYDFISCLNIIEHFTRDELFVFLDLIYQKLKPNGRVIFETPNADSPWFGSVAYGDLTHEWFFTPGSLADTLSLAGFVDYEARATMPTTINSIPRLLRNVAWVFIRGLLSIWNIAESGGIGSGLYTRVFVASAQKPE